MSVSYWQDTTHGTPEREIDILVIGAGIAGTSTAFWLRSSGLDVAVVDRGDVGAGATGRNAGFVTCGSVEHHHRMVVKHGREEAMALWQIGQENIDLIESVLVADGLDCDFARKGAYSLAGTDHEMQELEQSAALLRSDGVEVHMVSEAQAAEQLGCVGFPGGAFYPDDGEVHPVKLARGILERSGADFYPHHEVFDLQVLADGSVRVHTPRGRFRAQAVVLATNGYSHLLDPWFADRIYPTRGQILVTAPAPRHFMSAPCYCNFVLDYFRQLPDRRVLIGGFRQLDKEAEVGVADEPNPIIHEALEGFLGRHFPDLAGVPVEYRWAGTMGFSVDGLPMIGALPGRPQIYFVGGFTAHGIGMGFKAGQMMAALIAEGQDPGPLSARRLAGLAT
ncbi:MAG: NAD(P)/FAD-dependent oxidoreductase [Bradymonadia bacterium]